MSLIKILKTFSCALLIFIAPYLEAFANNDNTNKYQVSLLEIAINTFQLKVNGLIHIGASKFYEAELYKKLKINDIIWIDADPKTSADLEKTFSKNSRIKVFSFAATDKNGEAYFKINDDKQPGSLFFDLDKKTTASDKIVKVQTKRLDDFLQNIADRNIFNAIIIDVEGAELMALRGAVNILKQIDFIISEVNYTDRYNSSLITQLDDFLLKQGFIRVDTKSKSNAHGMALYIKNSMLNKMKK